MGLKETVNGTPLPLSPKHNVASPVFSFEKILPPYFRFKNLKAFTFLLFLF